MRIYKSILFAACALISTKGFSQNLVSSQSWTVSSGTIGVFSQNGVDSQNIREMGTSPFGTQTILWKAVADAANGSDGGWDTNNFPIDNTKMYRFAVWIKKTNSTDGYTYFGCRSNDILSLSGSVDSNPYFWLGDLPSLDKWYLLVGYIHGSGDASTTNYGGIYDGVTGTKVQSITDFKFSSSATYAVHRTYLYYDVTTSDRQYFYGPEAYKVDQPLAETILPGITNGNAFFGGNVGIGTTTPGGKLHVDGSTYIGNENGDALYRVSIGSSGGNYGSVGYGFKYTTASAQHTYAVADYASQLSFDAGGFSFKTAPSGTSGASVTFTDAMKILQNGNVGIGTTNPGSYKLAVEGKIGAREVNVIATNPWPDYVFEKNYKLPSLEEIKNYIDQNQHLPEVPSAKEVEKNGVNVGEMNALLLKKIEELTLYTIEMNRKMDELKNENQQLKGRVEKLEK